MYLFCVYTNFELGIHKCLLCNVILCIFQYIEILLQVNAHNTVSLSCFVLIKCRSVYYTEQVLLFYQVLLYYVFHFDSYVINACYKTYVDIEKLNDKLRDF